MKKEAKKSIWEFFKFCLVGALNTGIHLGALYLLTEYFNIYYLLASCIGFCLAVTNSFILNTLWTFKADIKEKTAKRYAKFFAISLVALGVNLGLLYLITEYFHIWYMFSQLIATAISLFINFLGNKAWTYKKPTESDKKDIVRYSF